MSSSHDRSSTISIRGFEPVVNARLAFASLIRDQEYSKAVRRNSAPRLHKVPPVTVQILAHGHCTVGLFLRLADEDDAPRPARLVISPEVVGMQEQEDAAASLIADHYGLFISRRASKEQPALARARRRNDDPPFCLLGLIDVFDKREAQRVHSSGDGDLMGFFIRSRPSMAVSDT
jgi:hypothetical protein